jgi:hypothetical protein
MQVITQRISGEAEPFNPEDPQAFTALAGDQLTAVDGDMAVVRTRSGQELRLPAGWLAIRPDGETAVIFAEPESLGSPRSVWRQA